MPTCIGKIIENNKTYTNDLPNNIGMVPFLWSIRGKVVKTFLSSWCVPLISPIPISNNNWTINAVKIGIMYVAYPDDVLNKLVETACIGE